MCRNTMNVQESDVRGVWFGDGRHYTPPVSGRDSIPLVDSREGPDGSENTKEPEVNTRQ